MSRSSTKSAAELERMAEEQIHVIRRAVREYNDAAMGEGGGFSQRLKKQRELERLVAEFVQINKTLKRIRKKMRPEK